MRSLTKRFSMAVLVFLTMAPAVARGQDGALDPAFGDSGKTVVRFPEQLSPASSRPYVSVVAVLYGVLFSGGVPYSYYSPIRHVEDELQLDL